MVHQLGGLDVKVYSYGPAARAKLRSLGLRPNNAARSIDHPNRSYWWFGDGSDALLDHSATLDKIGKKYYVAGYGKVREEL